ncbi:MAG: cytochrome C [Thalassobium sp.]|uniref:Cytochrome c n=1 Tax=Thalassolituus pacificus TaxID=2975440 RepID=A0A9X2WEF4_9GAMM|nr:cytochrome c [Thalassolituus pacificus]MCT7358823.1 cytochrome c [Thalassolituus pacificus]PHS65521.1 MAG: cytochrome C [Thalassobium sp.]
MNLITRTAVLAALMASSTLTLAEVKVSDAVEYRQGIYKAVRWNFGPMGDMVKGKQEFNADEFSRRAANLAALSKMPLEGFVAGSYNGTYSGSTDALPAIEKDWETFAGIMSDFETNAAALAEAASAGDMDAIRPAFMSVAKTCKSCHDKFKD